MKESDELQDAMQALAAVGAHQKQAQRAARLPLWVYAAMFVLSAGGAAINDFVGLSGAKLVAALVLIALVAVLVASFGSGSSLLSRVRGVQPRQQFVPAVFGIVVAVGVLCGWLLVRYGFGLASAIAAAVGLRDYPYTVAGVLFGAVFTAIFALSQLLLAAARRRTDR